MKAASNLIRSLLWSSILLSPAFAEDRPEENSESAAPTEETAEEAIELESEDSQRNRNLSETFENFQPSEEISADNAVTFPADI